MEGRAWLASRGVLTGKASLAVQRRSTAALSIFEPVALTGGGGGGGGDDGGGTFYGELTSRARARARRVAPRLRRVKRPMRAGRSLRLLELRGRTVAGMLKPRRRSRARRDRDSRLLCRSVARARAPRLACSAPQPARTRAAQARRASAREGREKIGRRVFPDARRTQTSGRVHKSKHAPRADPRTPSRAGRPYLDPAAAAGRRSPSCVPSARKKTVKVRRGKVCVA